MKKRLLSIILTAFLVLSMVPYAAFADSSIVCPACGGSVTKQERRLLTAHDDFFKCDKCGKWAWANKLGSLSLFSVGDQQILEAADSSGLLNFSFNNGHLISAEKVPSGVGRKDLPGYADENGTPSVGSTGAFQVVAHAVYNTLYYANSAFNTSWFSEGNYISSDGCFYLRCSQNSIYVCNTVHDGNSRGIDLYYTYMFDAPVDGLYYCDPSTTIDGYWNHSNLGVAQSHVNVVFSEKFSSGENQRFKKYGKVTITAGEKYGNLQIPYSYTIKVHDLILNVIPDTVSIKQYSKITINNNIWNGNIYVDNSNNLTYIYPQYTVNNETKISNNPIIYNNLEHKYYTYDSVTNNFYYINYEQPSATPTPKPTFKPGGGSSRGGGVGRHHGSYELNLDDWTKKFYILNDYDYDCYYGNFYVDDGNGTVYAKSEYRVSTAGIPISDGTYKVTVPDDINWRAWRWDENAKKAVAVNSDTWKSTMFYDFYASEDIIFEFRKIDGSEIHTKDITLRLDNAKITEYEPGGKKHAVTVDPILPDNRFRIIPNMTSNTFSDLHGTWSAFGSSEYSSLYTYFRAFTVDSSYWWTSSQSKKSGSYDREMPCWLAIEIPDPENYYIDGYVLKGAGSGIYFDDWQFQYSDDGSAWTDLDSVSDGGLKDQKEHDFNVAVHKAHKYYRWYFTKAPVSWPGLGTANLYGYNAQDVVVPTPTPAPSPTPAPTDPPTPTTPPIPGGDKPGGSGSGSGSGDNSWNPFKWLTDLLKDLIEDILKGLWKLLTSIFGFILWLLSLLFKLFPWMPNSGILALCAGVVVVTVIRIIKFITGR